MYIMLNVVEIIPLLLYLGWVTGLQWKRPNFIVGEFQQSQQTIQNRKTLSSPDELHVLNVTVFRFQSQMGCVGLEYFLIFEMARKTTRFKPVDTLGFGFPTVVNWFAAFLCSLPWVEEVPGLAVLIPSCCGEGRFPQSPQLAAPAGPVNWSGMLSPMTCMVSLSCQDIASKPPLGNLAILVKSSSRYSVWGITWEGKVIQK